MFILKTIHKPSISHCLFPILIKSHLFRKRVCFNTLTSEKDSLKDHKQKLKLSCICIFRNSNCKFCVHGFDWSTNPNLLKIDMHICFTMMHIRKSRFLNIIIGRCKFMQLATFMRIIYMHGYDWSINPIFLKNNIHVRFLMMHVEIINLKKNSIGN